MDFRGREEKFREADQRYAELKRQLDAGSISAEEFEAERQRLMVLNEGHWWAKSRETGEWHYHDGSAWVRGTPPGYQPPPTDEASDDRSQLKQGEGLSSSQTTPSDSSSTYDLNERKQRRGVLSWIIVAAGLVGVGIVIWLLVAYVAPYVQGEIEGPPSEEVPSSEEDPKPAPGYALVEDDSGNLSVEVPSGWDEPLIGDASEEGESWSAYLGESVGASITASADLDAWTTPGGAAPGVYAVASRTLAQKYTDSELVVSDLNNGFRYQCERGESQTLNRSSYSGRLQSWNCPGNGDVGSRTLFTVSAAPEGRECVVALQIWANNEADRNDAQHILDTFEVDCGAL